MPPRVLNTILETASYVDTPICGRGIRGKLVSAALGLGDSLAHSNSDQEKSSCTKQQ